METAKRMNETTRTHPKHARNRRTERHEPSESSQYCREMDSMQLDRRDVVGAYRRYAPIYDRLFGAVLDPGRRLLGDQVRSLAPERLLEVGVGTGLMLARYPESTKVVGIDFSEEMLEVARRRALALGPRRIDLLRVDAEESGFDDGSFDCVVLPYVLSVTPDPARLMREVRRVCRRGGSIFVLNHFSGSRTWQALEQLVRPLAARIGFRSDFSYDEHIARHGCDVTDVRKVNIFGLSSLVTIRNG